MVIYADPKYPQNAGILRSRDQPIPGPFPSLPKDKKGKALVTRLFIHKTYNNDITTIKLLLAYGNDGLGSYEIVLKLGLMWKDEAVFKILSNLGASQHLLLISILVRHLNSSLGLVNLNFVF